MNTSALPRLLTKKEVSELLRISTRKLDYLRKDKKLREVKIGGLIRFDPADIAAFINRRRSRINPLESNPYYHE